jgi:hypothetical protein
MVPTGGGGTTLPQHPGVISGYSRETCYFGLFWFILVFFWIISGYFWLFWVIFSLKKAVLTILSDFRFQHSCSSPKTTYKTGSGNKNTFKIDCSPRIL